MNELKNAIIRMFENQWKNSLSKAVYECILHDILKIIDKYNERNIDD